MRKLFSVLAILTVLLLGGGPPTPLIAVTPAATSGTTSLELKGVTSPIHDPTLVKDGNMYYVVATGQGIPIHCSPNMIDWDYCGTVFKAYAPWVYKAVPKVTDLWAPELVFWNGKWHLYYSASSFGSNHSAIGLATNVTLNQDSPDYQWVDEGEVISSQPTDNYNTIDPAIVVDQSGQRWLAFGSFWTGIKMRKIDATTGKLSADDPSLYSLASRPGITAIEGAYITYHNDYYYLFVSFDFCCKGVDSTYKIMVGRSKTVTGPYVDRDGKSMVTGGGSLIYAGSDRWRGPGHNMVFVENDIYYLIYHSYDATKNGVPTLRINTLQWDQDWPVME
jgi:arabinan endo-1,5-alpha-L-arabinosidase